MNFVEAGFIQLHFHSKPTKIFAMQRIFAQVLGLAAYILVMLFPLSSRAQVTSQPLLQQADLLYLGSFRVPEGTFGGSRFGYGGTCLAFNPNKNSLFIVGHDQQQQIAEISIPSLKKSSDPSALPVASVLQPFSDLTDRIPVYQLVATVKVGGLLVIDNRLYGTLYEYFDADVNAPHSHFRLSNLNLANGTVEGLFRVGANLNPGFVAGYMARIPLEWRDEFGVPYLTGQAALSIIGRTSVGPAALGFDPSKLGPLPAPVTPMVYYPLSNPLAPPATQNPYFNLATTIEGVLFPRGYRSVVFFGGHGIGPYCYGCGGVTNPGGDCPEWCYDPDRESKGTHAYPYIYQAWAYDVNDLLKVRNGTKQPWEIRPYALWQIDLPFDAGDKRIGGVAYDEQTGRVYISQLNVAYGAEPQPVIHVFELAPPANNQHAPSGYNLISPENKTILKNVTPFQLSWNKAIDLDGDAVTYKLKVFNASYSKTYSGISDISFALAGTSLSANTTYSWTVLASDGIYATASADTFAFTTSGWSSGKIEVGPEQAAQLPDIVRSATQQDTILLKPGTFRLSGTLYFTTDNVLMRSITGKRVDVLLDGGYAAQGGPGLGEVVNISANGIVVSNISIAHAKWHAIHLVGNTASIKNIRLNNLHVYDCGEQLIKSNPAGASPNFYNVDNVTLQNSLLEFIDNSLMELSGDGFYTGGLDVHAGQDWIVRDNVFRGINNNGKLMEHAIHFWKKGRSATVERNLIVNCYRGIGFGLVTTPDPTYERHYADQAGNSPYRDQLEGFIANNVVINDPGVFLDSGISLANTLAARIFHNTVVSGNNPPPFNSIEYRWSDSAQVINNLSSHAILEREGNTLISQNHNLQGVFQNMAKLFTSVPKYDLHLLSTATTAIDKAMVLPEVPTDFDKKPRGPAPDIGAFELQSTSAVEDKSDSGPIGSFFLYQNFPNPFNASTIISYSLSQTTPVEIRIYDLTGKTVASLVEEMQNSGQHQVMFDAKDIPSGIYWCELRAHGISDRRKLIVMR